MSFNPPVNPLIFEFHWWDFSYPLPMDKPICQRISGGIFEFHCCNFSCSLSMEPIFR